MHSLFSKVQSALKSKYEVFDWKPGLLATVYVVLAIVSQILDRMAMNEVGSPNSDLLSILILPLLYMPLAKAILKVTIMKG